MYAILATQSVMNCGVEVEENRLLYPIRKRLLKRIQIVALTVGILPLVSGIIAAIQGGAYLIVVADVSAYVLVFLSFFLLQERFTLNAVIFIVVLLLIGVLLLIVVGMNGASLMWLFTPVAVAALLLPMSSAIVFFGCAVLILITVGFLLLFNILPWYLNLSQWTVIAGSYIAITLFLVLSMRFIIHRLACSIQRERNLNVSLKQSANEKEELIRELHHRVKNNLQLIESILRLENYGEKQAEQSNTLHILEHRISALALSYSCLQLDEHALQVRFSDLLEALIDQVHDDDPTSNPFVFSVKPVPLFLLLEQAVPLSLLVTEILSHVFLIGKQEKWKERHVEVIADKKGEMYSINFHTSAEESLPFPSGYRDTPSMQIIQALIEQLSVTFDTNVNGGRFSKLSFPASHKKNITDR